MLKAWLGLPLTGAPACWDNEQRDREMPCPWSMEKKERRVKDYEDERLGDGEKQTESVLGREP